MLLACEELLVKFFSLFFIITMGKDKTSNPAERYHKEQRKKALKKNKLQRIKQRDERVAATETSSTIRGEIDALERKREKRQGYLDTTDVRKLERLQKELKIVLKAEEDRQKIQKEDNERLLLEQQQQHSYYCGDDPTTSYYYHPTLNPYGAPPPGRPMMWHCKFGGTTMDIRMAGFPGDTKQPSELGSTTPTTKLECQTVPQQHPAAPTLPPPSIPHPRESNKVIPSPPPPPPPPLPEGKPPQQPTHSNDAPQPRIKDNITDAKSIPEPAKPRLNGLPQLPEPSLAVRRGKKSRSLQADIWATTDELVYDGQLTTTTEEEPIRRTNQETTHQQQKRKRSNKDYDINDPCCPAGENYSDYRGDVAPNSNSNKLVNRWYYKDSTSGAVQGPFTSEQMIQWKDAGFFPPSTPMRNGETGPFRALSCIDLLAPLSSQNDLLELSNGPEGVEARLAALRDEMTTFQPQEEMEKSATFEKDIQTIDKIHEEEERTLLLPNPSPNNDGGEEESAYYYPVDTNELLQQDEVNEADYPTDLSYPVDLSYPIYEDDNTSYAAANPEIPVYPVHHLMNAPDNLNTVSEPIKKKVVPYKGDKDVVAFMPSHLQVKRQREDSGSIRKIKAANNNMTPYVHSLPQKATTQPVATSVTDDYNNFMEEINRLT